jgi:capsular polysaccharide biosynthesis protein
MNPAHSVLDTLSSLVIYEILGLSCPVVLPGRPSKKQAEIIHAFGLAEGALLTARDVSGCLVRCAIAPQVVSGQLMRSWYSSIAERAGTTSRGALSDGRADVVYISRAGAVHRPLVNEEELQDALIASAGARILHMEDLTLREEVDAIRAARIVIGPHGAGMHSMLFAEPGRAVVELLPETYPSRFFGRLADIAGHDYFPVCGRAHDDSVQHERDLRWEVDVDKVARVVERVLARGRGE